MGFEEARRAFNEDERWKSGPTYIFVDEVTPMSDLSRPFVFPPDPSREGLPWGLLIDAFGNDWYREQHRIVNSAGDGWIYYSFLNPATGRDEPKASYLKSIDWDGTLATIGAGIYRRDLPGTCRSEEVHAMGLDADPSKEKLQEFVRCAAMELESQGYFAVRSLTTDPRWGERLDLLVRRGCLRKLSVQRRSFQSVVRRIRARSLHQHIARRSGSRKCGGRLRGILPLLLGCKPFHQEAGTQGDFRQEGRGLWSADPW